MSKILFVPSNGTQVRMFKPVYDILNSTRKNEILAICIDAYKFENAEEALIDAKIPYRNIKEYGSKNVFKILKREKANIVILGNDVTPIEKSFVIAGNHLGIPTLLVQDGLIGKALFSIQGPFRMLRYLKEPLKWVRMYTFLITTMVTISDKPIRIVTYLFRDTLRKAVQTHTYGSSGCTKIAVAGNYVKNVFIQQGIPPERIAVTGQPRFDKLYTAKFDKQKFCSKIGCSSDKKIVTLCTQPFVEYKFWTKAKRKTFFFSIVEAIQKLPEVQLIVKLHPVESIRDYREILLEMDDGAETTGKILLCKDVDLYELINVSDILMTVSSTVALEAMIMDKPVLIVDLFNESGQMPYVSSGAASAAFNLDEMVFKIKELLFSEETKLDLAIKRKEFVYEQAYKIDGKAAQRVADMITHMIEES